jgi:hypothetical protein
MRSNHPVVQRLYLLPTISVAVLMGVGYYPTRRIAGQEGVIAMLVAQALVFIVVMATVLPKIGVFANAKPSSRLKLALKMAAQRMCLAMALGAVIVWRGIVEVDVFLIWMALAYLILVQVETFALYRWMKGLDS